MEIWIPLVFAGFINYLTRLSSIIALDTNKLSKKTKLLLTYVPSSVFPAIIFPAIFLDQHGSLTSYSDPKIIGFLIAIIIGFITRNLIFTIIAGLISYWFFIFVI